MVKIFGFAGLFVQVFIGKFSRFLKNLVLEEGVIRSMYCTIIRKFKIQNYFTSLQINSCKRHNCENRKMIIRYGRFTL